MANTRPGKSKVISFALIVAILLAGCGRKEDSSTLTFTVGGAPAEIDFWQRLVAEFQEQTHINVNLVRQPTDTDMRRQGLLVSLQSSQPDPDVFLMDVAWLAQFAASGWLEPLDAHAQASQLKTGVFFQKVLNLADRYQGQLIALPVYVDGGLLYYRRDLLEKHGFATPPKTWPQLLAQSLVIQKQVRQTNPDFYAFVWQGAQYEGLICTWLEFAASNGGGIILAQNRITLNIPANVQATQFMRDLIHTHKISPPNTYTEMKEEQVRTFFQQGNALFERNWPYAWSLHQAQDSPVRGKVGIAPLPHFPDGPGVSTLGGWHIGISKYSDAKEDAFKFVEFVTSYQTQKKLAINLGWNPGRRDVYADKDVLEKLPHFAHLGQVFENLRPRPNMPYYTLISETIQRQLSGVLSGKSTPSEALAAAQRRAQDIMDQHAD